MHPLNSIHNHPGLGILHMGQEPFRAMLLTSTSHLRGSDLQPPGGNDSDKEGVWSATRLGG